MIKILNEQSASAAELLSRAEMPRGAEEAVKEIIAAVRLRGDAALLGYTEKFDGVALQTPEVPQSELLAAYNAISPELCDALRLAARNITEYHTRQLRRGFTFTRGDGVMLGERITPLARVGVYVPGGTASYPSTVLMNLLPAKIAGVGEVVLVSPPQRDGHIATPILAAAYIAGADRVFACGGAQAVAALAYGTETVPRVDKITGPGNAYVAEAKRQVSGTVGIDMIAGPSEILIIADEKNDAAVVAADMLSQAEHDKNACAVLLCDSMELAQQVAQELEKQLRVLPREEIARASVENNGKIVVCRSLESAAALANELAPEHLEIMTDEPEKLLDLICNAGSVFLGRDCPEPLGDYISGTNHTLPTGGTARFAGPLSVDDFVKKTAVSRYSREALAGVAPAVCVLARAEGLEAHARAVEIRGKNKE